MPDWMIGSRSYGWGSNVDAATLIGVMYLCVLVALCDGPSSWWTCQVNDDYFTSIRIILRKRFLIVFLFLIYFILLLLLLYMLLCLKIEFTWMIYPFAISNQSSLSQDNCYHYWILWYQKRFTSIFLQKLRSHPLRTIVRASAISTPEWHT